MSFPTLSIHQELEAEAHIWNNIYTFIKPMSLKCIVDLGIPDIIHKHGKPMLLSELANALSIPKPKVRCLEHLMLIMIHSKFFIKTNIDDDNNNDNKKEGYWLTPSSLLLLKDKPSSLAPYVHVMLDPLMMDPWYRVSEWFRSDRATPFEMCHGRTCWEHIGQDSRVNGLFNDSMGRDSWLVSRVLVSECGHIFKGIKSMVDVGGGTGIVAKAICEAFPSLKCSVLDLPQVVVGLEGSENLTFVEGDMFKSIPCADAIFMKWILHNWSDEDCVTILKKCKEAIPTKDNGGKVIIVDMVLDFQKDNQSMENQLFYDIEMTVLLSGRERTEKEWKMLFYAAGFTGYKITNVLGQRSLIEVFP